MLMDGREMQLEADTGSPRPIVSTEVFMKIRKDSKLTSSNIKLKSYTEEKVEIYAEAVVDNPQIKPD